MLASAKILLSKVPGKVWFALGVALLAVLVLSVAYCKGESAGRTGEVVKAQGREIKAQGEEAAANAKAGEARVQDAVRTEQQKKELADALKATTDPDRRRAMRGCVILRQQGRDTSVLPGCQ